MNENKQTIIEGFWISDEDNESRHIFDIKDTEILEKGSTSEYSDALKRLENCALKIIKLRNSNLEVLVFEKTTPYSAKSPLDLMFLIVSKEPHHNIYNIDNVSSIELGQILNEAKKTLESFCEVAKKSGKNVTHKAISVNYHEDPLPPENTDHMKKTYAQTINLLHLHVFVLTDEDSKENKNAKPLSRDEKDTVNDPTNFILQRILSIPSFQTDLSNEKLISTRRDKMQFETQGVEDFSDLAESLKRLHSMYCFYCQEIIDIFSDSNEEDALKMPLYDYEMVYANIKTYVRKLRKRKENILSDNANSEICRLTNLWMRLARIIKESSKEGILNNERLFLRSPAYTLLLELTNDSNWKITLDPRVISTGNALNSLGFLKRSEDRKSPDSNWWNVRKKMINKIKRDT